MQHDVHTMHRPRRHRSAVGSASAQQMPVHVVDVDGGQLVHRQMTEQRLEMTLDHAAVLAQRRRRPCRRGVGQPAVQQIGDRAGAQPGVAGLLDEDGQFAGGVTARAVHGLGRPALAAGVGVDAEVDAQLPAVGAAFTK
jgi:hypothetical protein